MFSDEFVLRQAGVAQMKENTSRPEWQKYEIVGTGIGYSVVRSQMIAPYSDDLKDQEMIKAGFKYYNDNRSTVLHTSEED